MIINTSSDKNKKIVAEIEERTSDLKERIKKMSQTEKKNADQTLLLLKKVLITIKMFKKFFS